MYIFFGETGIWTQSNHSTAWDMLLVHFALVILETASWKLFDSVGLKLWSSRFQPPSSYDYRHEPPVLTWQIFSNHIQTDKLLVWIWIWNKVLKHNFFQFELMILRSIQCVNIMSNIMTYLWMRWVIGAIDSVP
jgi:hypothetical protein